VSTGDVERRIALNFEIVTRQPFVVQIIDFWSFGVCSSSPDNYTCASVSVPR